MCQDKCKFSRITANVFLQNDLMFLLKSISVKKEPYRFWRHFIYASNVDRIP